MVYSHRQDSQGDVLGPNDIPDRLNEQDKRIAELEKQLDLVTKVYLDQKHEKKDSDDA